MATSILNTMIEASYIKKYLLVDLHLTDDKITPVILDCQRMYIRPLLGRDFYTSVALAIVNKNTTPIAAEIQTLLNQYIAPVLGKYVVMKLRPAITHPITNKGSQTRTGEFAQPDSDDTIQWLMNIDLHEAQLYAKDLLEYLNENRGLYPLYKGCSKTYKGGLYLGPSLNYNGGYVNGRKMYGRGGRWGV